MGISVKKVAQKVIVSIVLGPKHLKISIELDLGRL